MALLDIEHLAFHVASQVILADVEMTVGEGEIHVLLGANGTGKTTLACLLMGCAGYASTAGRMRFRGRDLAGLPMHERARLGLTMAWQEPARIEGLPVWTYLTLGHSAVDPAEVLRRVGLAPEAYLDRLLDKTLSGGERKRIELAAVLALQPALAILDEPAEGIDLPSLDAIADVIQELKRRGGAVLLITHTEAIACIADRASYLCGGRIVLSGDPQTVAERYKSRRCVVCTGEACGHERAG